MGHRPHFLRAIKGNQSPANLIFLDTETHYTVGPDKRQYHHLWFGWACFQRLRAKGQWTKPEWHRFDTIDSFHSWALSKVRPATRLYQFAHNGAFDLPVLHSFSEMPARGWELRSAVVDAPPMILTWRKGNRSVRFVDTLNIWRMPLDKIGESIGIPKLPMPSPSASREEWDTYCKRDVEVIRRAVLRWLEFLEENDLGGFAPTLASQALRAYTHRFMSHKVLIDADEDALELARVAYLGGRVECFRIGQYRGDFHYVDVNSMYPAVMHKGLFPQALLGVYGRPTLGEFTRWLTHRCVIADVIVHTDEPAYPVVHDGRLCFPVGRFKATLCDAELAYALEHGHLESSSRAAVYTQAPLFKGFVDFMYGWKLQAQIDGDEVSRWLYKIMMNSLYGKFGQRGRRYENVDVGDPDEVRVWDEVDMDSGESRSLRAFGGVVQEWRDEGEARDSMPAIAACIASQARMALWRGLTLAGRENVLYCDTDSLVTNLEGVGNLAPLLDEERLGAWTVEDRFSEITLHGPKDYVFGEKRRTKGVRRSAEWIGPNDVRQDYFVGFRGLLREGSLDAPIVTKIEKHLSREYGKGTVGTDGRVSPFVFPL